MRFLLQNFQNWKLKQTDQGKKLLFYSERLWYWKTLKLGSFAILHPRNSVEARCIFNLRQVLFNDVWFSHSPHQFHLNFSFWVAPQFRKAWRCSSKNEQFWAISEFFQLQVWAEFRGRRNFLGEILGRLWANDDAGLGKGNTDKSLIF